MNAARLLALYERVAEAPDSIARLRRLVLDLAVRGKLTQLTRQKADVRLLGEVAEFVMGQAPPGHTCNATGNGTLFVKVGEFGKRYPEEKAWTTEPLKFAIGGDVLICVVGATVGKLNLAVDCAIGRSVAAIRPKEVLDTEYLYTSLMPFTLRLREDARGSAQGVISRQDLHRIDIWVPPLVEQRRIVAKVEELMALLDRLGAARVAREAARDRLTAASLARLTAPTAEAEGHTADVRFALEALPALTARRNQIRAARQTILNLAIRGKLVEQGPADEPACELLKRIAVAKAEAKRVTGDARIRPTTRPRADALPMPIPGGWDVASFENLFLFIDYRGRTPPKTPDGIPLITAKNVRMGTLNREPREFIAKRTFEAWMTRGLPRLGDLFFTTEAPLANICLNDITEPFALAQRVICLQPYSDIDTRYLMFAIMSDVVQELIGQNSTGLTAKGIKAAKLKPLPLPVPPLAEQHRIVAKVDALMALCDRLEAALAAADATRARLLESLLHEALAPAAPALEAAE